MKNMVTITHTILRKLVVVSDKETGKRRLQPMETLQSFTMNESALVIKGMMMKSFTYT